MKFSTTLLAVRDMDKSLAFYKALFGQEVVCDIGWNKTLTCGLVLQAHFDVLCGFPTGSIQFGTHNMELYFETEDMDGFLRLLAEYPEVKILHEVKEYPWHQRVIRIYDPDFHLIEVGENMEMVAYREFDKGLGVIEVVEEVQHPIDIVKNWYKNYIKMKHLDDNSHP